MGLKFIIESGVVVKALPDHFAIEFWGNIDAAYIFIPSYEDNIRSTDQGPTLRLLGRPLAFGTRQRLLSPYPKRPGWRQDPVR